MVFPGRRIRHVCRCSIQICVHRDWSRTSLRRYVRGISTSGVTQRWQPCGGASDLHRAQDGMAGTVTSTRTATSRATPSGPGNGSRPGPYCGLPDPGSNHGYDNQLLHGSPGASVTATAPKAVMSTRRAPGGGDGGPAGRGDQCCPRGEGVHGRDRGSQQRVGTPVDELRCRPACGACGPSKPGRTRPRVRGRVTEARS